MKAKNLITAIGLSVLLFTGCEKDKVELRKPEQYEIADYFATFPMAGESGMAMESGDFDKDGDLDLIVGAYKSDGLNGTGKLYFFENDGRGNLKPRKTPFSE